MVSFPPCKINLGLNIVSKRVDGYHNLETVFYPVPWTDILEIIPSKSFSFQSSGYSIPGKMEDNICIKAYELVKKDFSIGAVQIHLHKIIPMGAGLGGGSSNGAHTLRLLNDVFELKLSVEQLKAYAAKLGSDCSFFLERAPMLGTGRGEVLYKISFSLAGKFIAIVKPDIHVSTAEAYGLVTPRKSTHSIAEIIQLPFDEWKNNLVNDFEHSVFAKYPAIKKLKEEMYLAGASYASMSGSGSSVFGIFNSAVAIPESFKPLLHWSGKLN
jgi:4-diphosphocytidyl-2-C-methyl-D-erythritol kinase